MTVEYTQEEGMQKEKRPNYLAVFLVLAVLTAVEVGVSLLPFQTVPILVALAATKVVLVAMFYMHLKTDSPWYTYIFLIPIPFVILIAAALLIGSV